jgi:hypothetical protein
MTLTNKRNAVDEETVRRGLEHKEVEGGIVEAGKGEKWKRFDEGKYKAVRR